MAPAQLRKDLTEFAPDSQRIRRPAANVVDLAHGDVNLGDRKPEGPNQVVDEQDVTHLLTVAVNGDRGTGSNGDQKMRHPPLVFVAELPGPVNAAHAEHYGGNTVDPVIVSYVLVGGAF